MEQSILAQWQQTVIRLVAQEPLLGNFYLTGGTALAAYYLHHRFSDDLDFFISNSPDDIFLQGFMNGVKTTLLGEQMRFTRFYDRRQFFIQSGPEELKVEFTKYPFQPLEESRVADGIRIDSFRDIAANKLMALLDRFEPKDFVDLFFILRQEPLEKVRKDAEQKFKIQISSLFLGGELMKSNRIETLPRMILPLTIADIRTFFIELARSLAPEVLE